MILQYVAQRNDRCFNQLLKMGRGRLKYDQNTGVITCLSCISVYWQGPWKHLRTNCKHAFISVCKSEINVID